LKPLQNLGTPPVSSQKYIEGVPKFLFGWNLHIFVYYKSIQNARTIKQPLLREKQLNEKKEMKKIERKKERTRKR
jgi:hypothetical protein